MHSLPRRSILAAVMIVPLAGCGGTSPSATTPPKYQLVNPGVITAATQSEQPPFAMTDKDGKPTGFAVDLMNTACERLGMKVQYKTTNLQGMLAGLTAGQYDVGVAGVNATPERKEQVAFSTPFYWGFNAVVTLKDRTENEPAQFAGKRVGVVSGSVQETFATQELAGATLVKFKDQTGLLSQVLSKGIDAMVLGASSTDEYAAKYPLRIALQRDLSQGSAFPFRKNGDPRLLADIDAQIDKMIEDGTYLKLYRTYFKRPIAAPLIKEKPGLAHQVAGTDMAPAAG